MKNSLRFTIFVLVLAGIAGTGATSRLDGGGPQCSPSGVCQPGLSAGVTLS